MLWMGSYTQTFMPAITAQNARILDQSKLRVAQAPLALPAAREVANAR